ncbi:restriction endonuclease subunit S [Mycolicibacterium litorale]|uniref:restriction endonuclease subunit S n=1 Tax=Mycolicibacterium litorale TaxID=758802 RepID=UPI0039A1ADEB
MRGNRINFADARRVSRETFEAWTRRLSPQEGDLLFAREAPVGPVVKIPPELNVAPGQRTVLLRPDPRRLDSGYAYYLLASPSQQARLLAKAEGSTVPHLNVADVRSFELPPLPPVNVQRGIAATLGALDDKIESNRRIQSQVLDLADAHYRDACSHASTALPLKDVGRWLSGGTPSTSNAEYWGGTLPWVSAASMKTVFLRSSDRNLTPSGAEAATNIVPVGTILFVVRGMSLKSEFRLGIAQREMAFGQDCKAIIPNISPSVLVVALQASRSLILDLVDEAGHGTGRLPTDRLEKFVINVPTCSTFAPLADSLLARGAAAAEESDVLTMACSR